MEVKLIKNTAGEYYLIVLHKNLPRWFNVAVSLELSDGYYAIASSHHINGVEGLHKLSLTNCQAIERGYDLDELIDEEFYKFDQEVRIVYRRQLLESLTNMFQKALEILGDKKFSEQDVKKIIHWSTLDKDVRLSEEELFKSIQQTEWDVVIEMELIGECKGNNNNGCFMDSCGHDCGCFKKVPKLDNEGRLILKRK